MVGGVGMVRFCFCLWCTGCLVWCCLVSERVVLLGVYGYLWVFVVIVWWVVVYCECYEREGMNGCMC